MKAIHLRRLVLKMLWLMAVLSLGMMIVLSHILAGRADTPSSIAMIRLLFIAVGAVHWILGVLVPDWLALKALSALSSLSSFLLSGRQRSDGPSTEPNLFRVYLLRYAALNTLGVLGLILVIVGERIEYMYVFCGIAFLGLLLRRPSAKVTGGA